MAVRRAIWRWCCLLCILGCAVPGPQNLQAGVVTLVPTADAFVSSANPTNNYGGAGALAISAAGLPKGELQTLLRFDVATAKSTFDAEFGAGEWILQAAELKLYPGVPNNAVFNASAAGQLAIGWLANDSWEEGTGTPNGPSPAGLTFVQLNNYLSPQDQTLGQFPFNGATTGVVSHSLPLALGLAADVQQGGLLTLRITAGDSSVAGQFGSRSFSTTTSRPALTLTAVAVPEPQSANAAWGAWVLVAWGLGRCRAKTGRD